ncbi:hypothetical protein [Cryobacterium zongtaii]|nr:hypothetical protein [Cryobacterium zongtaii]
MRRSGQLTGDHVAVAVALERFPVRFVAAAMLDSWESSFPGT